MKDRIAKWYRMGLWSADNVLEAASKGILTPEDVTEILEQEE